jgi:phosphohistidine swiveling domain-containing protein
VKYLFLPKRDRFPSGRIGGKGDNLLLLQHEYTVPEWVALPASVFVQCLESGGLDKTIREKLSRLTDESAVEIAGEISDLIRQIPFPDTLAAELEETGRAVFGADYISVRSSAADEDGALHSFAGIHESFLYVRGLSEITQRIRDVWASGYQERALLYRLRNKLSLHPVPMAVLLQRMVNAETSGVVFTADPSTQDPQHLVISALYGLGEGLVSAGLDADTFAYDKRTGVFTATTVPKRTRYILDTEHGNGLREAPVQEAVQEKPALSEEQLSLLAQTALKIERRYGRPQDIEFCFDAKGQLYLLQTRAITTVEEYGPAAGYHQIWDNSNIIESYSGVTSPMTFSFIRHAYSVVYTCFSEVMGIPPEIIRENQTVYRNMLGLFDGQVYYNLPNWYRLVRQFPGYAYNKAFMESMMGVKDTADADAPVQQPAGAFRRYCVELPKLIGLASRMLYRFRSLRHQVPAFSQHFDHYYNQWAAMDFKRMQPHELMQVYLDMEKHLLRNWKTPIINDFYVMVFYGTLKACCKTWCKDEQGTLQNNLICGEGEIESTQPTRMLMKLASTIKAEAALSKLFLEHAPLELLHIIPRREETRHISEAVAEYLRLYGFRCVNELKLEEPSLHETPEFVYQMIANYVRMDASLLDLTAQDAREKTIRAEAEARAFASLSPFRKMVFRMLLRHARAGVKNRENMRFARTKIYGLLRLLLQAIGETFAREGLMDTPHDIFYLTIDEVWDFVKGTAVTRQLRALVALRKSEFDGYRAQERMPDDHFETYGMAYHRNSFRNATPRASSGVTDDGALHGIGCSPGVVEGVVRVIHSPRSDARLNGEILVAARTDPGWVPLYPSVSGLLIERGSILSHSAIVAREMGLPAIVGIPNLLKTLHDGQRVRMDASSGTVTLL